MKSTVQDHLHVNQPAKLFDLQDQAHVFLYESLELRNPYLRLQIVVQQCECAFMGIGSSGLCRVRNINYINGNMKIGMKVCARIWTT